MPSRTYDYRDYKIELFLDPNCPNPFDLKEDPGAPTITYNENARDKLGNTPVSVEEFKKIGERIARGELIGLPVYAYVHGGARVRTYPFKDIDPQEWDSGHSGWIYFTKKQVLERNGGEIVSKHKRIMSINSLKAELKEFNAWLSGECYQYRIYAPDGEEIDALAGILGVDYALEQAHETIDLHAQNAGPEPKNPGLDDEDEDDSNRAPVATVEKDWQPLARAARSLVQAFGGDVPDWLHEEVAAVDEALTALESV